MRDQFRILLIANNIFLKGEDFGFKAKTAKRIIEYLIDHKTVKNIYEAFYLGVELARAEQALKDGSHYEQG